MFPYSDRKGTQKYVNSKEMREEKKSVAKSLGEALKENRIRCQMTQEFAAETLGVSRQSVSTWENGFSDPNTSNLIALAKLYKISPEQLLECAAGMPDGESYIPPYACCAPSSAAPVPVQGRPPFDFWQHGRLFPGCHSQHKVFTSHVSFCVKMAVSLPDCSFILPGS